MTSANHFLKHLLLSISMIIPVMILFSAFTTYDPLMPVASSELRIKDTLPQTEVYQLKRADIFTVIVAPDSAKIFLKKQDSILMSRMTFDALPEMVKKEISAMNDGVFNSGQVAATFPGGQRGWLAYLSRTFRYPAQAVTNRIQGTVVMQFLVDEEGKVSDIQVVSGPESGGLREEATRCIKRSGKWVPATWNGYKVPSYKTQPLTFRLEP